MKNIIKKILKTVGIVIGTFILLPVLFILFLTVIEYKPKPEEKISINGNATEIQAQTNQDFSVITWNIGYGALGKNADYFMDGGTKVVTADKSLVKHNIESINNVLKEENPNIIFLQEVDEKATRSHRVNQRKFFAENFKNFHETYAFNFRVFFIPYPVPPIGKVHAGIQTLSKYQILDSKRISLPCPFGWPLKVGNLKRCILVDRIQVQNSNKELVIVNLHLEAYDSGEGKIAQTKLLRDLLQKETEKGNYVIAAGDFNQSFSNTDISNYKIIDDNLWKPGLLDVNEFNNTLSFYADNSTPTCRSLDKPYDKNNTNTQYQFYMLDGFIVSNNIEVKEIKTLKQDFEYTDHNPVKITVSLK